MNDQTNEHKGSDDFDDLIDEGDLDEEGGFEDFDTGGKASLWSTPAGKAGIIAGVLLLIVTVMVLFGGEEEETKKSAVATRAPDLKEAPGTEQLSPVMEEAMTEFNEDIIRDAQKTGDSAIPVPIKPIQERRSGETDEQEPEDPLERWRRMQQERLAQQRRPKEKPPPPPELTQARANTINNLAEAMANQMEGILSSKGAKPIQYRFITDGSKYFGAPGQAGGSGFLSGPDAGAGGEAAGAGQPPQVEEILVPAATIEYAQLMIEANTDAPGPVMAQIVTGPLKGDRVLGAFTATDEYLVLNFNTLVRDGKSLSINAVALDPDNTLPGLVTDIDRKYFQRVVLPAAAAFIEGMGEAIADTGSTTVTVEGDTVASEEEDLDTREELFNAVEELASEVSDFLDDEYGDAEPTIVVAAGTPMGLLFLAPVTESLALTAESALQATARQQTDALSGSAGASARAEQLRELRRLRELDILRQIQGDETQDTQGN